MRREQRSANAPPPGGVQRDALWRGRWRGAAVRAYLTAAEVAAGFRRSLPWFQRNRAALEARGFPRPVDGCGMRWDPAAIARWQDSQLPMPLATPEAAAEQTLLARARAMMAA